MKGFPHGYCHIRCHSSLPLKSIRHLANLSTTALGTSYENICAQVLRRIGFTVRRTGGRSDRGIDLLGVWNPPYAAALDDPPRSTARSSPLLREGASNPEGLKSSSVRTTVPKSYRVVVQCKAYKTPPKPTWIRELAGAVVGAPGEWRDDGTLGVLVAKKGVTDGCRDAMRRAERGIIWVCIESKEDGEGDGCSNEGAQTETMGRVTQMLWNEKVKQMVGADVTAGVRYVPGVKGRLQEEVVLMFRGRHWDYGDPEEV